MSSCLHRICPVKFFAFIIWTCLSSAHWTFAGRPWQEKPVSRLSSKHSSPISRVLSLSLLDSLCIICIIIVGDQCCTMSSIDWLVRILWIVISKSLCDMLIFRSVRLWWYWMRTVSLFHFFIHIQGCFFCWFVWFSVCTSVVLKTAVLQDLP